jgi:DNA-binding beta-propeller fold protein YncE
MSAQTISSLVFLSSPSSFISIATAALLEIDITTLAGEAVIDGSTNGIGTNARFYDPSGLSISPDSSFALVADFNNHLIRHIVLSTTLVTTFAGLKGSSNCTYGIGTNAQFSSPSGISISPNGLFALIADSTAHVIQHMVLSTVSVTAFVGLSLSPGSTNGIGTNAKFQLPIEVIISPNGVFALVADTRNCLIRHIIISTASVSTLAGVAGSHGSTDGIGTRSKFNNP